MKKNQPTNYSLTLPRVSAIVEYFYPFSWNARERFEDWLMSNDIWVDEYMKEASEWGTFVHSKLEDYLNGKIYRWRKYRGFIDAGIRFIKEFNVIKIFTEHYIRWTHFQWTIDLVCEIDSKEWIVDFKTFWLAKYKFWLPIPTHKKPSDKLKKARLQLSLYAYVAWIENIAVLELTPEWYYFYPLELIGKEQIEKLINEFNNRDIDT